MRPEKNTEKKTEEGASSRSPIKSTIPNAINHINKGLHDITGSQLFTGSGIRNLRYDPNKGYYINIDLNFRLNRIQSARQNLYAYISELKKNPKNDFISDKYSPSSLDTMGGELISLIKDLITILNNNIIADTGAKNKDNSVDYLSSMSNKISKSGVRFIKQSDLSEFFEIASNTINAAENSLTASNNIYSLSQKGYILNLLNSSMEIMRKWKDFMEMDRELKRESFNITVMPPLLNEQQPGQPPPKQQLTQRQDQQPKQQNTQQQEHGNKGDSTQKQDQKREQDEGIVEDEKYFLDSAPYLNLKDFKIFKDQWDDFLDLIANALIGMDQQRYMSHTTANDLLTRRAGLKRRISHRNIDLKDVKTFSPEIGRNFHERIMVPLFIKTGKVLYLTSEQWESLNKGSKIYKAITGVGKEIFSAGAGIPNVSV